MKKALTAASVERMKPPAEGQIEIFDRGYPGLSLRVSYGGKKSWSMHYRLHGKLHRLSLGCYPAMTLAEARAEWRKVRESVARGVDPDPMSGARAARPSTGFSDVAREWLQRDQGSNRSVDAVRRIVRGKLLPAFGNRPIGEIGRREIRNLIDGIADGGAVVMARRTHSYLNRLFAWAVSRDIIAASPMTGLGKPGKEIARDRVLNDRELIQVWNGAEGLGYPYGQATQLLILTGARREEISQLRWSEIEDGAIHLSGARTKNGEPHLIPLSAPARALLASLPQFAGSDFVFTVDGRKPVGGWSDAKQRLDDALKIETSWVVHDLRRGVSTGLHELGTEPHIVEAILGHKVKGVAGVYNKAKYEGAKRAALEAWASRVMGLLSGLPTGRVVPLRSSA
jgi:integrase